MRKGLLACLFLPVAAFAQHKKPVKVQFGIASYYSNKFEGRKTFTDEIFCQDSLTAASNTLPMHTWVRVTNLRNHKTVIVQINDKMHPRNRRLIDLSRAAAERLGFAGRGLCRVRVDVLGKKKPTEDTAGVTIQNDRLVVVVTKDRPTKCQIAPGL